MVDIVLMAFDRGARQVNGACGCSASRTQASLVVLLPSSSTSWRSELVR
nr:hypothetical protein [Pseudomonas peli]